MAMAAAAEEEAVMVCVRMRPLASREDADLDDQERIFWKSEECTISHVEGTKSFTFDQVFHSTDSTAEVYERAAAPIISSAVQGYNGTILVYGQTASGKTYTMLGTKDCPGILPMAIDDIFTTVCRIPNREFRLCISYMEIYNEEINDLLCGHIQRETKLLVREDIKRSTYVEGLSEEVVDSPEQVKNWLRKGEKNRHYAGTKLNIRSSRSHTIFRMVIDSKEKADTSSDKGAAMVSHLNLVDLGGSEGADQTGAEGIQLKEGCSINRSLFILRKVINQLSGDQPAGYINYRDSKLTRILQDSLGGSAKTLIICTVTPVSLEETLSTLQFASTAKKMKNCPQLNEVLDQDALVKRYCKKIEDFQRQLEESSQRIAELQRTVPVLKEQGTQTTPEKSPERREQELMKRLDGNVLKMTESLKTFFELEERSEHLILFSLSLRSEFNSQKAVIARGLADLSPEQSRNIRTLQMAHEFLIGVLQRLFDNLQYQFSSLCKEKSEYYANICKCTEGLLEEKRKQRELLTEIQHLQKSGLEQHGAFLEQLHILELSQNVDFYTEQILKDVAETEEEFQSIEAKVQQMENENNEANQYLERCSVHFDVQDVEAGIRRDNERLESFGLLLYPKVKVFCVAKAEVKVRNIACYTETEAALKTCTERTEELRQALNTLKEQPTPSADTKPAGAEPPKSGDDQ